MRLHAFRPLGAEDDAFLYLQAEQIGTLNPAFSTVDGNIFKKNLTVGLSSVMTTIRANC